MPTSGPAAMAVQAGDAGQASADALPDGILVADPHGRISFANRQLAALSGYDLDELIGLPVDIALRPGRLGGSGQVVAAVRDASEPKQAGPMAQRAAAAAAGRRRRATWTR